MIETIKLENMGTVNKNCVRIVGDNKYVVLYFSYETIVGLERGENWNENFKKFISLNEWSTTTGKLLNELEPDKSKRYPHARIMEEVGKALASL